ncbi:CheW domain-containing protein [Pseudomonas sp. GV071]|uniref:CheW domain-containing protein n=1 Tax=Pseudomonas sp. GV071 TaxID=2135754 RepID=UPI000D34DF20|nr:CheW domain-containing protein [Pseudomonas sp. GV071]PTQ69858.1 purine-binding chemotaxis protein CheW [Pseudomonas sp. GV071]
MSRPIATATRPQLALQSYLDGLLQEAAAELADAQPVEPISLAVVQATVAAPVTAPVRPLPVAPAPVAKAVAVAAPVESDAISLDEFEAAVLEEQVRDARLQAPPVAAKPAAVNVERPTLVLPTLEMAKPLLMPTLLVEQPAPVAEKPVAKPVVLAPPVAESVVAKQIQTDMAPTPPPLQLDGQPSWGEEPFECLLFDVAGLTLAVPLVCLGSIYPLVGQELTPLFGQPDWFLGILPCQAGNLRVLDTARWVMPDRYRDDFRQGLQYVISVQGYEWGLAVHQVSRSIRLDPKEVKWRSQRSQRPWLAGTVIEHMCALVDVAVLAELIASGAAKRLSSDGRVH